MTTFLRTLEMKEYVKNLDSATEGEQFQFNHEDCPAGKDVKERLYVKRAVDGWLFYCHHCNSKGYLRVTDKLHRACDIYKGVPTTPRESALLPKLEGCSGSNIVSEWPVEARLWWYSYGFDDVDATFFCVQYFEGRLWLRSLPAFVGRAFTKGWTKYRYVKRANDHLAVFCPTLTDKRIVVCEDLLSSYKVDKAGINSVCLLGTSASDKHIALLQKYSLVYIWLDEDEAGHVAAAKLYKRLSSLVDTVIIKSGQPKEHSVERIKEICHA